MRRVWPRATSEEILTLFFVFVPHSPRALSSQSPAQPTMPPTDDSASFPTRRAAPRLTAKSAHKSAEDARKAASTGGRTIYRGDARGWRPMKRGVSCEMWWWW